MMTTLNLIPNIVAELQAGRLAHAEQLCHTALLESPHDADVLLLLAISLHHQHRLDEAIVIHARLTGMLPDSALHWGNYATALRESGQVAEAEQACSVALRLAPDNAEQWINRGLLQLHQHDYGNARDSLLRAVQLNPESPTGRIHAARACTICRDYRADELIRPWRTWLPLDEALQLELADLHLVLGEANTALLLLEDLQVRASAQVPVTLLLAAVYERVNRLDAAQSLLDEMDRNFSVLTDANRQEITHQYAMLALRRGKPELAREMLEQAGPRNGDDYAHYFTLAEVCDKLGEHHAAMQALVTAHARQLAELKVAVPFRFEPGAAVLPAAVKRVSEQEYRDWPSLRAPDSAGSPIFIVGFPRSGTTLLEQMLDAHPALQSMDERPFFNILADQLDGYGLSVPADLGKLDQYACDELRKGYLDLVCSKIPRCWDTQLVDKNPLNMLWLPMIHRLFPEAKFILALRHPCDVLVSNYMQNFRASVLVSACSSFERLATAYVTAMDYWLYHVQLFKPNLLVSRYEDLVADPAAQTRRIAEFIGVSDATPMLHFDRHARDKGFIATPSYTQVIQPVNRKGLNRWLRYRDALGPALPILQPMLDHWGYSVDTDG